MLVLVAVELISHLSIVTGKHAVLETPKEEERGQR